MKGKGLDRALSHWRGAVAGLPESPSPFYLLAVGWPCGGVAEVAPEVYLSFASLLRGLSICVQGLEGTSQEMLVLGLVLHSALPWVWTLKE